MLFVYLYPSGAARQLPFQGSQAALQIAAARLPNLRHTETSSQTGRGNPFSFTPRYDYTQSQGDADCRVARPSLLAMTGRFKSLAPFSALYELQIGASAYPTSVIQRRAKPDVGIRSPFSAHYDHIHSQGDADSHDQCEHWFATAALPPSPFRENDSLV